ncbi:TetR family transcriptional regulator [Enemella dayhoffiae]|uniref:TetR family transcriptional regulator n=1 Tax=Enemella dayhoffiae TaxID=2016507 RepID=A0A255GSL2_9ACTN|nr:TetR/AcrR family transcriptional regulator [Enemella dayhoffiae]OYO18581.1 TetR family transcriptional regulator [Enemella dayhoffiae]
MATTPTAARTPRRGEGSYDERRDRLADSALRTLGELGYARTSLREIASNSPYTHGVVHYYFRDKTELIRYCVRHYKRQCVHRYDSVVADSSTPEELLEAFADKLIQTIRDDAPMHRLWYDLRTQSMFDPQLRRDVLDIDGQLAQMIGRVLDRYADLSGLALTIPVATAYAMLDGVLERALLRSLADQPGALPELHQTATSLLPTLFG